MTDQAKATKTGTSFRMGCAITTTIQATPDRIWALLTDAPGFPKWNSTITSIEGEIAMGHKLKLKVPSAPDRVFTPKVSKLTANESMEWHDGFAPMFKGVRTFTLKPQGDGSTQFLMSEELSGLMLPMIKGSLPDFAPVFEAYAADLKRAAEAKS